VIPTRRIGDSVIGKTTGPWGLRVDNVALQID